MSNPKKKAADEAKKVTAEATEKPPTRKRNVIFLTLDAQTEARLVAFIGRQRIKPDKATVAHTALVELLDRDEKERQ